MVTYDDLRDARIGPLHAAAQAWQQLSAQARGLEQRVSSDVEAPLRQSGWQGSAADEAFRRTGDLHDEFELVAVQTRNLAMVLRAAAAAFAQAQKNLQATLDAAASLGLIIHGNGTVSAADLPWENETNPQAVLDHRLAVQNADIYNDTIRAILDDTSRLDADYADALRKFGPDYGPGQEPWEYNNATESARDAANLMGLGPNVLPVVGTAPAAAAGWWRSLSDDQRQILLTAYPDRLGALDGLPTLDRDTANRQALHNELGAAANSYQNLDEPRYQRLQHLLDKLDASETAAPNRRLYLLGFDNGGAGQAVVAVGNPDTAQHTAIVVPGVSTNLDGMGGQIVRATDILAASERLDNGSVAVVAWLGYDAPQMDETVVTAAGSGRAEAGGVSLDRFADGLRASHNDTPSHVTALGHSYGSVVVGNAAGNGHHLAVDDIVTAGSPGMDVSHAADLGVGSRHVWAGATTDDPVASPGTAIPYVGGAVAEGMHIGHNTAPHHPEFGGNVYHTDTQGHSGYWQEGSQSLENQARVIVGAYNRVGLDYGTAP